MFPQPMSRPEFLPDDSHLDLTRTLEQHLLAGLSLDLALDLVLNELVVRAAQATRASAAALALARGDEMVCRAATGHLAPDLGVPLNSRDGLSGACLQTRQPQLSVDTEFDPRVDPTISRHLGIRSILIVPVFDTNDNIAQFTGVLEVFSTSPAAFSHFDQKLLEGFAEECSRIRHAAIELSQRPPAAELNPPELNPPELNPPEFNPPEFIAASPLPARRPPEAWTLVLGSLVILATIAVSFLIGYRIGWLRPTAPPAQISQPIPAATSVTPRPAKSTAAAHRAKPSSSEKSSAKASAQASPTPAADDLVVYEKGKVIFRMKPTPTEPDQAKHNQAKPDSTRQDSDSIVEASSTTKIAPAQSVWLSPAQAETRLLSRTEPRYPPDALAAHRAGNVVLEVQVAEDGSVSSIRTLSGDPLLAAAATEAVRTWRYQPYRLHDHPSQFQTDVTLSFALPN
jgi:TonB family protein